MEKNFFLIIFILLVMITTSVYGKNRKNDREMLEHIAKNTFDYFWNEANPENGLIHDASNNHNASNAVIGFGLSGLCIAAENKWITRKEAYDRALLTLRSFSPVDDDLKQIRVEQEKGHHYHWVDINNGKWVGYEGIYASDTAAFIAGVITAGSYFKGTEVENLANRIYEAVDWTWFYDKSRDGIYVGWEPKTGFGGTYSANKMGLLPILLAISSPAYPVPASAWFTLAESFYQAEYKKYKYVGDGAAYTHQWPFCFIDPRYRRDINLDYYHDIRSFVLASRQWCIDHAHMGYSEKAWGLNVAAGPDKYGDYAAPVMPNAHLAYNGRDNDGTVVPTAAVGSVPFAPKETIAATRYFYEEQGEKLFGKYGFKDTFNLKKNYWSDLYLGIDQGPILIGIDNYLNGTVWRAFMSHPAIKQGLDKIGYVAIIDNFERPDNESAYALWKVSTPGAAIRRTDSMAREGKKSLEVNWHTSLASPIQLTVYPGLDDFTEYRYLGIWQKHVERAEVKIITGSKKMSLKKIHELSEGSWHLVYYDLAALKGKIKKIDEIEMLVYPARTKTASKAFIDHVHLTGSLPQKPDSLEKLQVKTGKYRGEIESEWIVPQRTSVYARMEIVVSGHKIETWDDFHSAGRRQYYKGTFTPGDKKIVLHDLIPGQEYSVAVAAISPHLVYSDFLTAVAIANSDPENIMELDNVSLSDSKSGKVWQNIKSESMEFKKRGIKKNKQNWLELNTNNLSGKYGWFGVGREISGSFDQNIDLMIELENYGTDLRLEFKLTDVSGAVYGYNSVVAESDGVQRHIIPMRDIAYWWSGDQARYPGNVKFMEILFVTEKSGKQKILLKDLKVLKKQVHNNSIQD